MIVMAEFFQLLMRINTILIDFNRDMWGYIAINYFTQKSFANEVALPPCHIKSIPLILKIQKVI